MNFFHIVILSIVEGITEFLPISSTFHIDLVAKILSVPHTEFFTSFMIAIQLGAIGAIAWLMKDRFIQTPKLFMYIGIAFIPIGFAGFFAYPLIKNVLLGNILIEIIALAIGGIAMLFFAKEYQVNTQNKNQELQNVYNFSLKELIILGFWQILALIPGMSRSGSVLIGGLTQKMPIQKIVIASFLLAIPTVTIATGYDLLKTGLDFSGSQWASIGIGAILSGIVAYGFARWLLKFVQRPESLYLFGWYRVILALILGIIFLM